MMKPNDPARLKALFAIGKLSRPLVSDVISDGKIAELFNISVTRPMQLSPDVGISQDVLFDAFRQVLQGQMPQPLTDLKGSPLAAEISIGSDGVGILRMEGHLPWRFENVGLLASRAAARLDYLDRTLLKVTLATTTVAALRGLLSKPDFSNDDFVEAVFLLQTSLESFAGELEKKVGVRSVGINELLPTEERYWDNLIAAVDRSTSQDEFIDYELESERCVKFAGSPQQAMRYLSLSFSGPELVPLARIQTLSADFVTDMLQEATKLPDHFALVGGFEICGDWVEKDGRFVVLGEQLLDKLFSDTKRLSDACAMFSAAYTIASARLSEHKLLGSRPAFWRRITAAAHAGLVVRTCGVTRVDAAGLLKWSMQQAGKASHLGAYVDSPELPRWHPDWIQPHFMIADAFSRVDATMIKLAGTAVPPEWIARVESARAWIETSKTAILAGFPALAQGSRRNLPKMDELGYVGEPYKKFCANPTPNGLVGIAPFVFAFGVSDEVVKASYKVIAQLRHDAPKWEAGHIQVSLMLVSYIASQARDLSLGDAVCEFCLERASELETDIGMVFRLIESSGANPDVAAGRVSLARRLEALAFLVPAGCLVELHDTLLILQRVDPRLTPLLGKALAVARLGIGGYVA